MNRKVMLVPSPSRPGTVDRVMVIGRSSDPQHVIVLNVDALSKSPHLLSRFNPGYHHAAKLWAIVSSLIIIVGIVLSFVWHWWAFLVGIALGFMLYRANQKSIVDFAQEALANDSNAAGYFASQGLVWEVNEKSLVAE